MARDIVRVLVSAYACEPGKGSEPGVGWNWVRRIGQHHDVVVMTRANNRLLIEAEPPLRNVEFVYLDLPPRLMWWKKGARGARLYAYLWQILVWRTGKRLVAKQHFDLVHHLTWATYWMPAGAAFLKLPFVFGPVGGGTRTPWRLWRELGGPGGLAYELVRVCSRFVALANPLARLTWRRAAVIMVQNSDTLDVLPTSCRPKALIAQNAGVDPQEILSHREESVRDEICAVFAGRIVAWKGVGLAVKVVAADPTRRIRLHVIGEGPDLGRCRSLARSLGVSDLVEFHGWLSRTEVLKRLRTADVFLFPSLHDEGPLAVTEAMSQGVRPVVVDLGGPAISVTDRAGRRVAVKPPGALIEALHAATLEAALIPAERALERSRDFAWPQKDKIIAECYAAAMLGVGQVAGS